MEKKLPGVFANKIDKPLTNNKNVYYSTKDEEDIERSVPKPKVNGLNINQKIQNIFSSSRYVYKADVDIKLKDKTISKKIVGKNATHLITIDNELIPISDIVDIDYSS